MYIAQSWVVTIKAECFSASQPGQPPTMRSTPGVAPRSPRLHQVQAGSKDRSQDVALGRALFRVVKQAQRLKEPIPTRANRGFLLKEKWGDFKARTFPVYIDATSADTRLGPTQGNIYIYISYIRSLCHIESNSKIQHHFGGDPSQHPSMNKGSVGLLGNMMFEMCRLNSRLAHSTCRNCWQHVPSQVSDILRGQWS